MNKQTKPARRTPKANNPVPEETPSPPAESAREPSHPFPIVGIGASAGGLEALELFLANVPKNSGMAFVIVQHLDPTHKGIMVELLQRGTPMPVVQVKNRTRAKPDCVYVIPPNKDMSILRGVLHLLDPATPRGLRLPIDFFFRALADDQQEHSIGGDEFAVLLPGTNATAAEVILQRVRRVIQENNAAHTGTPIHLSLGVSTAENRAPLSGVLKKADANMYREKQRHAASQENQSNTVISGK
jgi:chemotaxis response regulator CheB